ncbi:MAG: OmpH family outer membrane protein [Bdellovibrionota bacterium]
MRIFSFCAAALLGLFGTVSAAHAAPDVRVGYVDIQRALASSVAGKSAQKKYEDEVKRLQASLDGKKGEFEKLKSSYVKQKDSLNDKARADKEEELRSREKDLQRAFQDSQETLRRKNTQLVGELVEKMKKVVDEYGKQQGFTVILEKGAQSVLYADSKIDITDSIVEKFDQSNK